ncbi:MAG: MMPL family transporter [Sulfurovum sp.]|nr:MMPL family transporter [Sulfurovum sp.]
MIHQNLEIKFSRYGRWITSIPIKIVLFSIAILIPFIVHVPKIKIDTSTEGFMHPNDPVLQTYNHFREQFGREERVIVAIKSDKIFTLPFLQTLRQLHQALASSVPHIDDITSLYNVRNTLGEEDKLYTDDLLEPFPKTQADVERIKHRAMKSHFYKDLFVSSNGNMTAIILESDAYSQAGTSSESIDDDIGGFDEATQESDVRSDDESGSDSQGRHFLTDQENSEFVQAIHSIVRQYRDKGLDIYVAGSASVVDALKVQMRNDMQKFTRTTFLIIVIFFLVMFRRISATIYPVIVVILALLTTVGAMAWTGVAFKLPTQIVPSLLLAVSVGATVHVLSIFFDKFNEKGDKAEAIEYTLGHSGLAIAMTSITTAIGVGSFAGSEVAPISDLGIFAAFGVLVSLFLTLTLLPALLMITRLKPRKKSEPGRLDRIMEKLAILPIYYYKQILIVGGILVMLSLAMATKIEPSHNPLFWFQPDNINRVSTLAIDREMNGSLTIEAVVDTGKENGWNDPVRLKKLDTLAKEFEHYRDPYTHIGKVVSLHTIVKETNKALHANDEHFYTIPNSVNLVAQELLLFENSGSDDLEDVVDSQFSKVRITVKIPWTDSVKAVGVRNYLQRRLQETFPNDKVEVTGMVSLLINTFSQAVHSAIQSYFIAFTLISLMMILILGSVRLGLFSMIPNLVPIILGLFIMVLKPISLDMFTLLIGSIAIGLAVDDTIHFMHNFKRYYRQTGDSAEAIRLTFFTTGKALVITSMVLSLGFFSFMMGTMISVQNFGLLTGSVIIFALLSDLLIAPAMMIVIAKRGWVK